MSTRKEIEGLTGRWMQSVHGLQPLSNKEHNIPGSVKYYIRRFLRDEEASTEDVGIVNYNYNGPRSDKNGLTLRFCVAGNMYCQEESCQKCTAGNAHNCGQSVPSYDVVSVDYSAPQLAQFINDKSANTGMDSLLRCATKNSFQKIIPLCCKTRSIVEGLVNHNYTGSLENIYVNAQLQMLLLYSVGWISDKEQLLSCRFLNSDSDRQKIALARDILIKNLGQPITIKELSKRVATNECYLKKGFKEMYGTTIFEFYQTQRMEHAKYLLYEKGLNVTDVSSILGYSSISHFSTAFKKLTGLKPCELLLR